MVYQVVTIAVRMIGPKRRQQPGALTVIQQRPTPVHAFRVIHPDSEPDDLPDSQTLPQFFAESIAPTSDAKPSTRGEHALAIHRWGQFCDWQIQNNLRSICPALIEIDTKMVAEFLDWMTTTPHENRAGLLSKASPGSANKSLVYVRSFMAVAVEHGLANPLGRTKRKKVTAGDHRIEIPADHIDALMRACSVATWPSRWWRFAINGRGRGCHIGNEFAPSLFWRCQIVWLFTFGQRRGDIVGLKPDNRPLCWANVIDQAENPHPNGSASNPTGWLAFTQSKTAKDLCLPIPRIARTWLDQIAATVPERLPTDVMLSIGRSHKTFYDVWRAIADAAKVKPKAGMKMVGGVPVMSDRGYQLKNFRSTAASAIERHAKVGRLVTGHACDHDRAPGAIVDSGVFENNYLTSEVAVLNALATLPLPASFTDLLPA